MTEIVSGIGIVTALSGHVTLRVSRVSFHRVVSYLDQANLESCTKSRSG